jgi:hypothetical protein
MFTLAGNGVLGSTSPIGQGWVDGSGSALLTSSGVKKTSSRPGGSVTQPCEPNWRAVSVGPPGMAMRTSRFARSTTGLPTFLRSE